MSSVARSVDLDSRVARSCGKEGLRTRTGGITSAYSSCTKMKGGAVQGVRSGSVTGLFSKPLRRTLQGVRVGRTNTADADPEQRVAAALVGVCGYRAENRVRAVTAMEEIIELADSGRPSISMLAMTHGFNPILETAVVV